MFTGSNEIVVNQATMKKICQSWIRAHVKEEVPVEVTDVSMQQRGLTDFVLVSYIRLTKPDLAVEVHRTGSHLNWRGWGNQPEPGQPYG